jgi:hypothetical protein
MKEYRIQSMSSFICLLGVFLPCSFYCLFKTQARRGDSMPIILTTQEAEIGGIKFQSQPHQKVSETPISVKSQLCRKHKQEDCGPGWPRCKREILSQK